MWVLLEPGDSALVPSPSYPIHIHAPILAGASVTRVPMGADQDLFANLEEAWDRAQPKPRVVILSFPHNPTTATVDFAFMERVVAFAREHELVVVHDFAYADLAFDGYEPPSILQVPGAEEVAVELYSLTKSFSMAGWRVGFVVGNAAVVSALARLKSWLDYGTFQPIQIAAIVAMNELPNYPREVSAIYQSRRDALCDGLDRAGWSFPKPKGTMFVWAPVPEQFKPLGSLAFAEKLAREASVAVSPGVGFGADGDDFVRFALVENEQRIGQAVRGSASCSTREHALPRVPHRDRIRRRHLDGDVRTRRPARQRPRDCVGHRRLSRRRRRRPGLRDPRSGAQAPAAVTDEWLAPIDLTVDSDAPEQIATDLGRRHALYLREAQRLVLDGLVPDERGLADGIRAETERYRRSHPWLVHASLEPAFAAAENWRSRPSMRSSRPLQLPRRAVRSDASSLQPSATIVGNMAVRKKQTGQGLELSWDAAANVTEWKVRVSVRPDPRRDYVEGDTFTLPAATTSFVTSLDDHPRRIQLSGHARDGRVRAPRDDLGADEWQQRLPVEAAGDGRARTSTRSRSRRRSCPRAPRRTARRPRRARRHRAPCRAGRSRECRTRPARR